jgi:hypothetical protein
VTRPGGLAGLSVLTLNMDSSTSRPLAPTCNLRAWDAAVLLTMYASLPDVMVFTELPNKHKFLGMLKDTLRDDLNVPRHDYALEHILFESRADRWAVVWNDNVLTDGVPGALAGPDIPDDNRYSKVRLMRDGIPAPAVTDLVDVVAVHLPHKGGRVPANGRLQGDLALLHAAPAATRVPYLVAGDFNQTPRDLLRDFAPLAGLLGIQAARGHHRWGAADGEDTSARGCIDNVYVGTMPAFNPATAGHVIPWATYTHKPVYMRF